MVSLQVYVVECAGVGGVPAPELSASVGPRRAGRPNHMSDVLEDLAEAMEETKEEEEEEEDVELEAIEDGGDGLVRPIIGLCRVLNRVLFFRRWEAPSPDCSSTALPRTTPTCSSSAPAYSSTGTESRLKKH